MPPLDRDGFREMLEIGRMRGCWRLPTDRPSDSVADGPALSLSGESQHPVRGVGPENPFLNSSPTGTADPGRPAVPQTHKDLTLTKKSIPRRRRQTLMICLPNAPRGQEATAPDPFDPESLRLGQDFTTSA